MLIPHFKYAVYILVREMEHGHRHSDFIIEIAFCFQRFPALRKNRVDHFLGRGFAYASRYADREHTEKSAVVACEIQQRASGIRNNNHIVAAFDRMFCNRTHRSFFKRLTDEAVSIEIFTLYCNKQTARFNFSRICTDRQNFRFAFAAAAYRSCNL